MHPETVEQHAFLTLERHIMEGERAHPQATGEFTAIMHDMALAAKLVWREVTKAGLVNILGSTDRMNISGDVVRRLDAFADLTIYRAMERGGHLCVMASEENEDLLHIPEQYPRGKYALLFDPLDGSTNIDANVTIGTIFSVYRRVSDGGGGTVDDVLQAGMHQVAAGYFLFGSSMMFVYCTGHGVHGFTLDPSVGEFLLSHPDIRIPERGSIYSANEGHALRWEPRLQQYVRYLKEEDPATQRPYSLRYVGSLVADVHRTLLYGGVYFYPGDTVHPEGKLRLTYEANPLAYLVEQAGGAASTGSQRILEVKPATLHQRTPLFIGSRAEVALASEFLCGMRQ